MTVRRCLVLGMTLCACRETDEHWYVPTAVWSDDGERIAFAINRFDTSYPRRDPRNDRNENERFEVWTSALDGSHRERWAHGSGDVDSLYDMRSAGYIVFEHHTLDGREDVIELRRAPGESGLVFDVGGPDDVCPGCEVWSVLPSHRGHRGSRAPRSRRHLGRSEPRGGTRWGATVSGIHFFDRDQGRGSWITDDEYWVERQAGTTWRWRRGHDDLEVIDRPHCSSALVPATTSSPRNADDQILCGTEDLDAPVQVCECQDPNFDHDLNWCYQGVPFGECPDR